MFGLNKDCFFNCAIRGSLKIAMASGNLHQ